LGWIALVSIFTQAIKVREEDDRERGNSMAEYADVSYGKLLRKQMLAGGLAGMLADAVMYPMMTVKSRLMVSTPSLLFWVFSLYGGLIFSVDIETSNLHCTFYVLSNVRGGHSRSAEIQRTN